MRTRLRRTSGLDGVFYEVGIYRTLFDEFLLERIWGNSTLSNPQGSKRNYYSTKAEAVKAFLGVLESAKQKGYLLARSKMLS